MDRLPAMTTVLLTGIRDGCVLVARCQVADRPWSRGRGLLGRRWLEPDEGLLIEGCSSVHSFGMRFAIDVAFLDQERRVLAIVAPMAPWRFAACRGARAALELPAGRLGEATVSPGDRLRLS